jgi:hypothetical protein
VGTQVSGSLALDLSKIIDETVRQVSAQLGPALEEVRRAVTALAASANRSVLNPAETVATLSCYLPAGLSHDALPGHRVAEFQAEQLAQAGYALVAVSGPALEAALAVQQQAETYEQHQARVSRDLVDAAVSAAYPTVETSAPYANDGITVAYVPGGPQPADYLNREQRADERLAQARRDGVADTWFEEPQ